MSRGIQVLYLHGLGSSINNRTGTALAEHFRNKKTFFERLIYSNPGSEDKPWRVNEWLKDMRIRGRGDWVLVATSAGAHCALNAAVHLPEHVKGLFLFCPGFALDFSYVEALAPGALKALQSGKSLVHPASRNGYPALVDQKSFQEFLDTCVSNHKGPIPIQCPVRILHGTKDDTVPFQNSLLLASRLATKDVEVTIVDGGTHYLDVDDKMAAKVAAFVDEINNAPNSKL